MENTFFKPQRQDVEELRRINTKLQAEIVKLRSSTTDTRVVLSEIGGLLTKMSKATERIDATANLSEDDKMQLSPG